MFKEYKWGWITWSDSYLGKNITCWSGQNELAIHSWQHPKKSSFIGNSFSYIKFLPSAFDNFRFEKKVSFLKSAYLERERLRDKAWYTGLTQFERKQTDRLNTSSLSNIWPFLSHKIFSWFPDYYYLLMLPLLLT